MSLKTKTYSAVKEFMPLLNKNITMSHYWLGRNRNLVAGYGHNNDSRLYLWIVHVMGCNVSYEFEIEVTPITTEKLIEATSTAVEWFYDNVEHKVTQQKR